MTDAAENNPLAREIECSLDELDNELQQMISFPSQAQREIKSVDDQDDDDGSVDLDKLRKELNGANSSTDSPQSVSHAPMDLDVDEEIVVDENTDLDKLQSDLDKAALTTRYTGSTTQTQMMHTTQDHKDERFVKEVDDSDSSFSSGSENDADLWMQNEQSGMKEASSFPLDKASAVNIIPQYEARHESDKHGVSAYSRDVDFSNTRENEMQQIKMGENRASSDGNTGDDENDDRRELINEVDDDDSSFSNEEDFLDEDDGMEDGLFLLEEDLYSDEQYQTPVRPDPPAFTSLQAALLSGRGRRKKTAGFQVGDGDEYGESSQLPGVEEYKTSMGRLPLHVDLENPYETSHEFTSSPTSSISCSWRSCAICFILVLLPSVLIPLLVIEEKQTRIEEVMNFLSFNEISKIEDLKTPGSPQYTAAIWIADKDRPHVTVSNEHRFLDRYVLAVLYFSLGGDVSWADSLNFLQSEHVCSWGKPYKNTLGNDLTFGVHGCRLIGDEFVPISLSLGEYKIETAFRDAFSLTNRSSGAAFHGLKGTIPGELRFLNELEALTLQLNPLISGDLPSSLRALTKLQHLSLEHCSLGGSIPTWLGELTELTSLGLGNNRFEGPVPDTLADLTNLQALGLDDNALAAELELFGTLTNLKYFYLDSNEISGKLTTSLLERWQDLVELDLSGNQISGYLPEQVFSHKQLKTLDLHGNRFIGPIPSVNVELNDNLEFVALHENSLTNEIPPSISSLVGLRHLDLSRNSLEGALPSTIGSMMNLRYLFVGENTLQSANFPQFLVEMETLEELSLVDTGLVGSIPDQIGNLSNLNYLDLSKNQLSATVPVTFGLLTNLRYLLMRDNLLSGALPPDLVQLAALGELDPQ